MAVFFVNGTEVSVEKNQRLLRYLRDTLHPTSVKDGCSEWCACAPAPCSSTASPSAPAPRLPILLRAVTSSPSRA